MATALPMESNPETMTKYLQTLGVPSKWRMIDVIALEGEPLAWVPRPVLAVILLFPLSESYEEHRSKQEIELLDKGEPAPKDVFHLKQVVSNVCGTVALVHSVANNIPHIELSDGLLKKYIQDAKNLDASGKGALLEASNAIFDTYNDVVGLGDTEFQRDADDVINNHFVTFVHKDGLLYELDGRKAFPISHGKTTQDDFLEDAAKVCREFIAREPDNIGFNVVALVPSD